MCIFLSVCASFSSSQKYDLKYTKFSELDGYFGKIRFGLFSCPSVMLVHLANPRLPPLLSHVLGKPSDETTEKTDTNTNTKLYICLDNTTFNAGYV